MEEMLVWQALLSSVTAIFSPRLLRIFHEIASGWILCPVRRTITGMIPTADPEGRRSHDAYHHFFRDAVWAGWRLWRSQTIPLIAALCSATIPLVLIVDDTLIHKSGRHVEGAGVFRDPVRSTAHKTVYALGINVVLLCVRVRLPCLRQPLALPVHCQIYEKGGPSRLALAAAMVEDLAAWFPLHRFVLVADGAYASLAKLHLSRTTFTSRLRRDAAIYDRPAPRQQVSAADLARRGNASLHRSASPLSPCLTTGPESMFPFARVPPTGYCSPASFFGTR